MALSTDLASLFAKATNDEQKEKKESNITGTVKIIDGKTYVKLDNSERLTPVTSTTNVSNDDKVNVLIKNHTATVTGNLTSPSANSDDVSDLSSQITAVGNLVADKITTSQLNAQIARIDNLESDNVLIRGSLRASEADITTLKANNATITGKLEAAEADIDTLEATSLTAEVADLRYADIEFANIGNAAINNLKTTFADIEFANINDAAINNLKTTFADIEFANIKDESVENLYAKSGIIKDLYVENSTSTGEIVGVTISGDRIIGHTIVADKIVLRGDDGLLYKLNTENMTPEELEAFEGSPDSLDDLKKNIHGSNIIANSITAEKLSVSDLVAFGATIGGFNITDHSLYSGVKESVDNTTPGIYMDDQGQMALGDSDNYIRYQKIDDENSGFELSIKGVSSITTKSKGYSFDDNGLKITSSSSNLGNSENELTTTITENGMTITKNDSDVLKANDKGVTAKDLNASTYLIIGGRSRFENYRTDRTGCFWIGGE